MTKQKDPAVLFYTSDFLSGVAELTMEERGQYITLLCLQHQKGHLSGKLIKMNVGRVSGDVLSKFSKDPFGKYYNERMELETLKRQRFVECRRENGKKGGRPPQSADTAKAPSDAVGLSSVAQEPFGEPLSPWRAQSEEYEDFKIKVEEYFYSHNFISSPLDFIAYNESREWRGVGGEDVRADFIRYAWQWEEIQKMKNERFSK